MFYKISHDIIGEACLAIVVLAGPTRLFCPHTTVNIYARLLWWNVPIF